MGYPQFQAPPQTATAIKKTGWDACTTASNHSVDQGFEGQATAHTMADAPLADYGVAGVDNSWLSTGLSGVIGVGLCFVLSGAVVLAIRWTRRRSAIAGG